MKAGPEKEEILEKRKAAGLTQTQAAEKVHSNLHTWKGWEYGDYKMHPGLWELFSIKTKALIKRRQK